MDDENDTSTPGVAVVGGPAGAAAEPADDDLGDAEGAPVRQRGGELGAALRRLLRRGPSAKNYAGKGLGLRRARGRGFWVTPFLLGVTAISIVVAIGFGLAWSNLQSQENTRATVRRVASDFLLALTNFRPNTIDSDFRAIATYATGNFAKQSSQFFGSTIRQQLESAQASSEGQLRYIYIQNIQGNQASVYAEVDQTYANAKVTTPQADVLQVALGMVDTPSGWKISAVSVLQPPASPSAPSGSGSATGGG